MNNESIIEIIKSSFPALQTEIPADNSLIIIHVAKKDILSLCKFLKETLSYDFLQFLTCIDRTDKLEIQYHIYSYDNKNKVIIKSNVERTAGKIASVAGIWETANWHERETYDLFGVVFEGHPNLKRILLEEDFSGHPLLKDFSGKNVIPLPKI